MLERRYRALLRAYPSEFRAEHGDQLVATFLDGARPGQRRPDVADVVDVLGSGLRRRLGLDRHPEAGVGLRRAAPVALALLVAVAGLVLFRAGSVPRLLHPHWHSDWLAIVLSVGWLIAVAAWAVLPRAAGRVLLGVALGVTVALQFLAAVVPVARIVGQGPDHASLDPQTLGMFVLPALVALLGTRDHAASVTKRAAVLGAGALAVASGVLWMTVVGRAGFFNGGFLAPWDQTPLSVAAITVLGVLVVLGVRARRHGDSGWLWAAAALLLPVLWLVQPAFNPVIDETVGRFATTSTLGGLSATVVLLAAVGVLVIALRSGATRPLGGAAVTTTVLGVSAALAAVLGPIHALHAGVTPALGGYAVVLLVAAAWRWWPAATPYLVTAVSLLFLAESAFGPARREVVLAGILLGPVVMMGFRDRPARPAVWPVAAATLLLAPLVFTDVDATTAHVTGLGAHSALSYLVATLPDLLLVPFAMAVLVGADRVVRGAPGRGWAFAGLLVASVWILLVTMRGAFVFSMPLFLAVGIGVLLARRVRARTVVSVTDTEPVL